MAAPEGYKTLGKIGISYKGDYNSNTAYERLDAVLHNGSTYLALVDAPDGAPRDDKINWIYLAKGFSSDIGDSEITFTEAEARENINTGESVKTVFGKVKKWLAGLAAAAFMQVITSYADLMAGTALDNYLVGAAAVKEGLTEVNSKFQTLQYRMLSFSNKQSGCYYYSDKVYGYGVLLVMDNSGILDFYSLQNVFNNATAGGTKILPTKSLGDKTSTAYVHYRDSTYDLQIVFTDKYSHGTVIIGGAITNYSRSLWT